MTSANYRRLALGPPLHRRVFPHGFPLPSGGRIFATLAAEAQDYGDLMLTPEQQASFLADAPELFLPIAAAGDGWE